MNQTRTLIIFVLLTTLWLPVGAMAQTVGLENLPKLAKMEQAGLLVLNQQNQPLISKQATQLFVPASTTKLVTAYLALSLWGEQHRFRTDFFIQSEQGKTVLLVKGYGDPFLVSEELMVIAQKLSELLITRGVKQVDEIRLDTSYFSEGLTLPGTSESDNPYDAVPSAIAANFNTLYLYNKAGKVYSAEKQTPITPLALELGAQVGLKKERVNTGPNAKVSQRYFAELLAAFLRQQGVKVSEKVEWGKVSETAVADYQHFNSMTLVEMIRPMMKYSTNFIANQLALMMAAESYGAPVDNKKVTQLYQTQLERYFDWKGGVIEEGAGLSRSNRLSPEQLVELLQAFKPWKDLLPEIEAGVIAKSGSLIGVSTLAGYIQQDEHWLPFALMMNQKVPYRYRNKVAKQLRAQLKRPVVNDDAD